MIPIGVLTPHAAPGPEVELPDMASGQVAVMVSRIPAAGATASVPGTPPTSSSGLRDLAAPEALDAAVAALADEPVDVIEYASTRTGYAIGFAAESTMVDRLSQRWSFPAISASLSAGAALRALHVQRVAVVHPPWFDEELNDLGATYFRSQGFDVVSCESAALTNDPRRIEPRAITEWTTSRVGDDAEAVFIGGTGFRAAGATEALEARLGRPVVESNQALLWSILASVRAAVEIGGYGRLFGQEPSSTEAGGRSGGCGAMSSSSDPGLPS